MRTRFGQGLDWPLGYKELEPYYRKAEFELGVSGDVEDQDYLGLDFEAGYVCRCTGCRRPTSTRWLRASTEPRWCWTGRRYAARAQHAAGAQRHSQHPNTIAARVIARSAPSARSGRGRPSLPGQHQLRSDLPGPGEVQRRQDAVQGARIPAVSICCRRPWHPKSISMRQAGV